MYENIIIDTEKLFLTVSEPGYASTVRVKETGDACPKLHDQGCCIVPRNFVCRWWFYERVGAPAFIPALIV
jgi:hypothetical protein